MSKWTDMLWKSDEPEEVVDTQQTATQETQPQTIQPQPTQTVGGVIEEKYTNHINALFNTDKIPGIGYGQFIKSLNKSENFIGKMTESERYNLALSNLQVLDESVDKTRILETANKQLDILNEDLEEIEKTVLEKKEKEIGSREKQITDLKADTLAKQKQIEELNSQILKNKTAEQTINDEIITQTRTIEQNRQNYLNSWNVAANKVKTDISNITSFISETH